MRDPLGLNERLFAAYYPRLIQRSEVRRNANA